MSSTLLHDRLSGSAMSGVPVIVLVGVPVIVLVGVPWFGDVDERGLSGISRRNVLWLPLVFSSSRFNSTNEDIWSHILNHLFLSYIPRTSMPASSKAIERCPIKVIDQLEHNEICVVCIERFLFGDEYMTLPCKHYYHNKCILPWLKEHNTCPTCRFTLESEDDVNNPDSGINSPVTDINVINNVISNENSDSNNNNNSNLNNNNSNLNNNNNSNLNNDNNNNNDSLNNNNNDNVIIITGETPLFNREMNQINEISVDGQVAANESNLSAEDSNSGTTHSLRIIFRATRARNNRHLVDNLGNFPIESSADYENHANSDRNLNENRFNTNENPNSESESSDKNTSNERRRRRSSVQSFMIDSSSSDQVIGDERRRRRRMSFLSFAVDSSDEECDRHENRNSNVHSTILRTPESFTENVLHSGSTIQNPNPTLKQTARNSESFKSADPSQNKPIIDSKKNQKSKSKSKNIQNESKESSDNEKSNDNNSIERQIRRSRFARFFDRIRSNINQLL